MRVLITGVTGLIGSHLANFLINEESFSVWGLKRFRSDTKNIKDLRKLKVLNGDILDQTSMEKIIKASRPDIIFHEAAQSYPAESWDAPKATLETNILGTLNILEAARKLKRPPKTFLACSSAEYGITDKAPTDENHLLRPVSPYGVSKVATEALGYQYHVNYDLPIFLGRYFIQVGPGQDERTSIQTFCQQMAMIEASKQKPIIFVGNLKPRRDFLDVRDGVRATWLLVNKGKPGEPYNICSGKAPTMHEVLDMVIKQGKKKVKVKVNPKRLRSTDEPIIQGSHKKLTQDTGWKPQVSLKETITWVLNYWRERV